MKNLRARLVFLISCIVLLVCSVFVSAASIYPLKSNVTLTYWMELHSNVSLIAKNFGDIPFAKELEKRTGVKVKYIHPAAGQAREAFNLMLASGDLPDIIEYNWYAIPGGPNSAINNGQILKLNPVIAKYAPNLRSYLRGNKDLDRMIKTDEGNYYVFPFFRGDPSLLVTSGPIVRKDWLDELGLKVPETYDEWYTVLKAFKEKKGATAPLTVPYLSLSTMLGGGADSYSNFYVEKGKVGFGPILPTRKRYFETLNKWYEEGLLDKNFSSLTGKMVDANILGGKSGATYGPGGSGIGRYLDSVKGKDGKFNLVGAPYPSAKKGIRPKFANATPAFGNNQGNSAITTRCKNVEAAARLLDYGYSKEGSMFYNFGIEGLTYKMVDGNPLYTEFIQKNPENLSNTQVMSKYMRAHTNGPFVQDKRYLDQYYEYAQQKEAMGRWRNSDHLKYILPPVTPTPDESAELTKIMGDINTYIDEYSLKFIMGVEPISKFDEYVAQIRKMGIDKAIAINQKALERYNKRK